MLAQVDLVCHGKTEVFPDKDGADPYAVSALSSTLLSCLSLKSSDSLGMKGKPLSH